LVFGFIFFKSENACLAHGDEPVNGFPANVVFRVFCVVDLGGRLTAVHAGPVVAFENYVTFALPGIGFQVPLR
jgi:hypothetical protein